MSQPSEDHAPEVMPQLAQAPFERPSSELQRAVQLRALESMERQRVLASRRPNRMGRIALFALALIPVGLLFTAVDGLLRVFHHMNDLYNSPEAFPPVQAEQQEEITQSEPGVVLLQPPKDLASSEPAQTH